jgi:hypothetical protein
LEVFSDKLPRFETNWEQHQGESATNNSAGLELLLRGMNMSPNGSLISALPVNESTKSVSPSRVWNGIAVRYDENDPGLGEKWIDLLSDTTTVVIRLAQKGGYCEPRLNVEHEAASTLDSLIGFQPTKSSGSTTTTRAFSGI